MTCVLAAPRAALRVVDSALARPQRLEPAQRDTLRWCATIYPSEMPEVLLVVMCRAWNQSGTLEAAEDVTPAGVLRSVLEGLKRVGVDVVTFESYNRVFESALPSDRAKLGINPQQLLSLKLLLYPAFLTPGAIEMLIKDARTLTAKALVIGSSPLPIAALVIGDVKTYLGASSVAVHERFQPYLEMVLRTEGAEDGAGAKEVLKVLTGANKLPTIKALILSVAQVLKLLARNVGYIPNAGQLLEVLQLNTLSGKSHQLGDNAKDLAALESLRGTVERTLLFAADVKTQAEEAEEEVMKRERKNKAAAERARKMAADKAAAAAAAALKEMAKTKDKKSKKGKGDESDSEPASEDELGGDVTVNTLKLEARHGTARQDIKGRLCAIVNAEGVDTSDDMYKGDTTNLRAAAHVVVCGFDLKPGVNNSRAVVRLNELAENLSKLQGGSVQWHQTRDAGNDTPPAEQVIKNVIFTMEYVQQLYTVRALRRFAPAPSLTRPATERRPVCRRQRVRQGGARAAAGCDELVLAGCDRSWRDQSARDAARAG